MKFVFGSTTCMLSYLIVGGLLMPHLSLKATTMFFAAIRYSRSLNIASQTERTECTAYSQVDSANANMALL